MLTVVFCLLFSVDAVSVGRTPRWTVGLVKNLAESHGNGTINAQKKSLTAKARLSTKVTTNSKLLGGRQLLASDPIGNAGSMATPANSKSGWGDLNDNPNMNSHQNIDVKLTKKSLEVNATNWNQVHDFKHQQWAFKNGSNSNLGRLQGNLQNAELQHYMLYNNVTVRKRGRNLAYRHKTKDDSTLTTDGHSEREQMNTDVNVGANRLYMQPVQEPVAGTAYGFNKNYSRVIATAPPAGVAVIRGGHTFTDRHDLGGWTTNVDKGDSRDYANVLNGGGLNADGSDFWKESVFSPAAAR